MKLLISAFVLSMSLGAMADSYYRPSKMSCDELKETLADYRSIPVVYGILGVSRGTMWDDEADADKYCNKVQRPMLRTQSGLCLAGYMCDNRRDRI